MVTKTAGRVLDDLALLGVAGRSKKSDADNSPDIDADNSPDIWVASDWLREHWPQKVGPKSTTRREGEVRDEDLFTENSDADDAPFTPPRTFRSCFDDRDGICRDCHAKPPAVNGRCAECHIIHVRVMAGYDQ
jgi:hypothetical protein